MVVTGSYDCGHLIENSKYNVRKKHVAQTFHCAARSLCRQHSVLCCSACNLELPSETNFKVTSSVQQGFTTLQTNTRTHTHTLHRAIYCTCEQVKATFQSDENEQFVSSASQTNDTDSQKESFGPSSTTQQQCGDEHEHVCVCLHSLKHKLYLATRESAQALREEYTLRSSSTQRRVNLPKLHKSQHVFSLSSATAMQRFVLAK